MAKKILVVGGVAGGASAAARLRRLDEQAEIILFERGKHISFANCGLPYYVGGVIQKKESLLILTPQKFMEMFNIDVRVEHEVLNLDIKKKSLQIKELTTEKVYEETYDYLVLSPGAKPIKPPLPGVESKNVFTIRNIPDVEKIKEHVRNSKPKRAVVIGAGYIGLEMAENLHALGMQVAVVEKADQALATLDYDMAALVHDHILSKDVRLYLKDGLKSIADSKDQKEVTLESGKKLLADLVILAVGVKPDIDFLKESGIELGSFGGIKVNNYLQTSDPYTYAVGDAIETKEAISGVNSLIPLAGPANRQGRIAANNVCGQKEEYLGTQGTGIAKVFDLTVAGTGLNESTLTKREIKFLSTVTHSKSNAGYYPGALPMTVKLLYSEEGLLLGAQIVGYEGVDKRIDVLATALGFKKKVYDLQNIELAYAPPFSSAKDPVNIAGYVASNTLEGTMEVAYWHEIDKIDKSKVLILDVGEVSERDLGAIEDSINIPLGEVRHRLHELSKDKEIITYCQLGLRGYIASRILKQEGFKVRVLTGGFKHYKTILQSEYNLANQDDDYGEEHLRYADLNKQEIYNTETGNVNPEGFETGETIKLNACGLSCPGPIVQVYKKMGELASGEVLEVTATDPGFLNDIKAWANKTGNKLLTTRNENKQFTAVIQKGLGSEGSVFAPQNLEFQNLPQNKTLVVFSGELDKAIASFIIANGAAAMGRKVTMFFTFWGLNILRKPSGQNSEKDFMETMFGRMMPRGSEKLGLSKMNMLGMGAKMIRGIMNKKNIASLEELIEQAQQNGVKLMACNMSMDVMGIKKEELIDGVDVGGVAAYLGEAEESNVNLFI